MNKQRMPILEKLLNHKLVAKYSFHVPGHKNGLLYNGIENNPFNDILKIDQTELNGLDDLHSPEGCIGQSQTMLQELYDSYRSYYLINGSTVGNLAAVFSTCESGDKIIVQRNSHKSVLNAIKFKDLRPIFLEPEYDMEYGTASYLDFETVKQAIDLHSDAKAFLITSPNYYGLTTDYTEHIKYIKSKNIIVICDEAHGAHFIKGAPFPQSTINQGAHIVIQSAHKTLPAMTMASWMHISRDFNKKEELEYNLSVLQSSSPSYPLMASLDYARFFLENLTSDDIYKIKNSIENFIDRLNNIPQIYICKSKDSKMIKDFLKIKINSNTVVNGFELQARFESEGIYTELADENGVLLIHPLNVLDNIDTLITKIYKSVQDLPVIKKNHSFYSIIKNDKVTSIEYNYKELSKITKSFVDIKNSIGMVCAQNIIPYPPGIPFLIEGETITEGKIIALNKYLDAGFRFQGTPFLYDGKISVFNLKG
jgi:lysine decarboxylase